MVPGRTAGQEEFLVARFIREFKDEIVELLSIMCNSSYKTAFVPED